MTASSFCVLGTNQSLTLVKSLFQISKNMTEILREKKTIFKKKKKRKPLKTNITERVLKVAVDNLYLFDFFNVLIIKRSWGRKQMAEVKPDRQQMMGGEEWELEMQRPIEGYQLGLIAPWWAQRSERKQRTLPMVPVLLASPPLAITAICHGAENGWMHSDTNRLYKHAATGMLDVGNSFLCYISSETH